MNSNSEKQCFPFCAGVVWEVYRGVIQSKLSGRSWNRALSNRSPVITCFGGFFEHFLALSYIEALNKIDPSKKIYFNGKAEFNDLVKFNGLASITNSISEEKLKKYPIPLFFDNNDNVYFNCLFNYIKTYDYIGNFISENSSVISKQAFINSCVDWNIHFTPIFRKLDESIEFAKWKQSKKFNIDRPYVLIFPDRANSMHKISELGWSVPEVKSFVSMCSILGMHSAIVTKNVGRYTGITSLVVEPSIERILCLIEKCTVILSEEVDYLLTAMLYSKKAIIFGYKKDQVYNLKRNQKYLKTNRKIIEMKKITPINVFKAIK